MSAVTDLLADCDRYHVRIERRGDKVNMRAPAAPPPGLVERVIALKPELLAILSSRERLVELAGAEGIDPALVNAPGDLRDLSDDTMRAYVRALGDTDLRDRGKVPPDETAAALCRHCGPVWIHPAVASCAPVLGGIPRVLGCAWCHVRNRKTIPRPQLDAKPISSINPPPKEQRNAQN